MIIALTGFMGSGKSSIGRVLAEMLSRPFIDLDAVIEEREGRSIPDIFADGGEPLFRRLELDALRSILSPEGTYKTAQGVLESADHVEAVLSLGGGTLTTPECAALVRENTLCIYLRATVDTLVDNLIGAEEGRPMLSGADLRGRVEELMARRSSIYETASRLTIDTDGLTYPDASRKIQDALRSVSPS